MKKEWKKPEIKSFTARDIDASVKKEACKDGAAPTLACTNGNSAMASNCKSGAVAAGTCRSGQLPAQNPGVCSSGTSNVIRCSKGGLN